MKMIIERDLPITMDDGQVLRADVYRPDTKEKVPVVMAGGPYGMHSRGLLNMNMPVTAWVRCLELTATKSRASTHATLYNCSRNDLSFLTSWKTLNTTGLQPCPRMQKLQSPTSPQTA